MTVYLGIDPGFSGAIASLDTPTGSLQVLDMPVLTNTKGKTEIDHIRLFEALRVPESSKLLGIQIHCYLEFIASRPGQSAPAMFRLGQGYGALEMAIAANRIPVTYVTPTKWKKYFGLSSDKGASRGLATQRFPQHADLFARVKDDGRAEAALIALYAHEHAARKAA
jgi:crossover junction endodeoxyribonuclease RuvC